MGLSKIFRDVLNICTKSHVPLRGKRVRLRSSSNLRAPIRVPGGVRS